MMIDVESIKKLDIQPGQTLVVQVDVSKLPSGKATQRMQQIATLVRSCIPDDVKLLIAGKDVSFTVITPSGNTNDSVAAPLSPQDSYDRAMKGL